MCGGGGLTEMLVGLGALGAGQSFGGKLLGLDKIGSKEGGTAAPAPQTKEFQPAGATKPDRTQFEVPQLGEAPPSTSGLRGDQWGNPLQALSFGATQGTQGGQFGGFWRSPEGAQTFTNLALNYLVDPSTGAARQDVSVLPIMDRYLTDVLGQELDYEAGRASQAHYLSRLLDYA